MISVTIPLKTVSEANSHEHWRARQKRAKGQRDAAGLFVLGELNRIHRRHSWDLHVDPFGFGVTVTITRLSARQLDSDNLASSQKHVRDGVADALGIDDRDPRVRWEYAQEKAKGFAVRIEITRDPLVAEPRPETRAVRDACEVIAAATNAIRAGRYI